MKEYFKYKNGYLNITDEAIFLTGSGNWSEIKDCKEKSSVTLRSNTKRKLKTYLFLLLLLLLTAFFFIKSKNSFLPLGFLALLIAAWYYISSESGNRYKIPLSKIKSITLDASEMRVNFLNETGDVSFEIITGLEEKGIHFFTENKSIFKIDFVAD